MKVLKIVVLCPLLLASGLCASLESSTGSWTKFSLLGPTTPEERQMQIQTYLEELKNALNANNQNNVNLALARITSVVSKGSPKEIKENIIYTKKEFQSKISDEILNDAIKGNCLTPFPNFLGWKVYYQGQIIPNLFLIFPSQIVEGVASAVNAEQEKIYAAITKYSDDNLKKHFQNIENLEKILASVRLRLSTINTQKLDENGMKKLQELRCKFEQISIKNEENLNVKAVIYPFSFFSTLYTYTKKDADNFQKKLSDIIDALKKLSNLQDADQKVKAVKQWVKTKIKEPAPGKTVTIFEHCINNSLLNAADVMSTLGGFFNKTQLLTVQEYGNRVWQTDEPAQNKIAKFSQISRVLSNFEQNGSEEFQQNYEKLKSDIQEKLEKLQSYIEGLADAELEKLTKNQKIEEIRRILDSSYDEPINGNRLLNLIQSLSINEINDRNLWGDVPLILSLMTIAESFAEANVDNIIEYLLNVEGIDLECLTNQTEGILMVNKQYAVKKSWQDGVNKWIIKETLKKRPRK